MTQETIEQNPTGALPDSETRVSTGTERAAAPEFVGLTDARDLLAKRPPLISILFDRRLVLRAVNGVVLAALDLTLLFASLVIALRVKTVILGQDSSLRDSIDYAYDVLPF